MKYAITRIHGNELPPRDEPGGKIKALNFVLDKEPVFPNCRRVWILNQIQDLAFKEKSIRLIEDHGCEWYDLEFDKNKYLKCNNWNEKVVESININKARNFGLDIVNDCDFNFLLDGDCFFNQHLWDQTISELENDQLHTDRSYYGVPYIRIINDIPDNYIGFARWEPGIVFRRDAKMRFDESIPFSKNDKVELLNRLGYDRKGGYKLIKGDLCINIGSLLHIAFNDERIETDLRYRMNIRDESINLFLSNLDYQLRTHLFL